MGYTFILAGTSDAFADDHPLVAGAERDGEVVIIAGADAPAALAGLDGRGGRAAIVIELRTECLGVHTGETRGTEGSNVLGFARYCLDPTHPTNLVELVRQPETSEAAVAAAKAVFEAVGLQVAICGDFPGRIVDRLVRPYFNAALRRLDEGLATADDLDKTLRLGLGYPEGPISLLERTGLERHFDVTQALYEAIGEPAFAAARRARVAKQRRGR